MNLKKKSQRHSPSFYLLPFTLEFFSSLKLPILFTLPAFFVTSCDTFNPEADIPSYIDINIVDVATNYNTEGTDAHNIYDVWIFVDDVSLGAYELPAHLPVLEEGVHEVKIIAGIKVNGMTLNRDKYPFYAIYSEAIKFEPGKATSMAPVITYYKGITFSWLEDFEAGSSMKKASNSDTGIQLLSVDTAGYLGNWSAVIYLDDTSPYFEAVTSSGQFVLPRGNPIYLELNYSCNTEFSVGIIKNAAGGAVRLDPYLTVNPSVPWNKIYINLSDVIKQQSDAITFEIYFSALKNSQAALGYIYLDNIKLLHS